MSTGGVAIGIATSSGDRGGGGGGGELCRLITCTVTDLERVVSSGCGSIRSLSKSSTERDDELK